ncbi:MAG: ETC complex I subunit [Candidatus Midichloria sp.]|nr:ETC complex I subunit [Candidatus Midichloria sp.]
MYTDKNMAARIYQAFRSTTQSGKKSLGKWVLEFTPQTKNFIEPVMGWTGGYDTLASEVKLYFNSKEAAMNYAANSSIEYEMLEPKPSKITLNSYINNFSHN